MSDVSDAVFRRTGLLMRLKSPLDHSRMFSAECVRMRGFRKAVLDLVEAFHVRVYLSLI